MKGVRRGRVRWGAGGALCADRLGTTMIRSAVPSSFTLDSVSSGGGERQKRAPPRPRPSTPSPPLVTPPTRVLGPGLALCGGAGGRKEGKGGRAGRGRRGRHRAHGRVRARSFGRKTKPAPPRDGRASPPGPLFLRPMTCLARVPPAWVGTRRRPGRQNRRRGGHTAGTGRMRALGAPAVDARDAHRSTAAGSEQARACSFPPHSQAVNERPSRAGGGVGRRRHGGAAP